MDIRRRLLYLFNLRADEASLVSLLLGLGVAGFLAMVMVRTAAYSLFLAMFEYQALPYVFIAAALFAVTISILSLKAMQRFPLDVVLLVNGGMVLGLTLIMRLIGGISEARWAVFTLPVGFHILMPLLVTTYWTLVQRLFNIQQSRRLTGLIASSETLAMIAGGFLTPLTVALFGTVNVLLVAVLCLLLFGGLLFYILRRYGDRFAPATRRQKPGRESSDRSILRSRYVLLILANFSLFVAGIYFVDNIFYGYAQLQMSDPDLLATFLGRFWGFAGILILLMQIFAAGQILSRYGVSAVLLLTPLAILTGAVTLAAAGTLGASLTLLFVFAVITELFRVVLDGIDQAATNVIMQPLPDEARTEAQTLVTGIAYPTSLGLTGLALILCFSVFEFSLAETSYVLVGLTIVWAVCAFALGRQYPAALKRALKRRSLQPADLQIIDAAGLAVLEKSLADPNAGIVVLALNHLERLDPGAIERHLPALLNHAQPGVRRDVMARIERLQIVSALPLLRAQMATELDPAVQGALLGVMAGLAGAEFEEYVTDYIRAADPAVRRGALTGLLRSGSPGGAAMAGSALTEALHSPDPEERILAAQVLGEGNVPSLYQDLIVLMSDANPQVQRAAIQATRNLQHPTLWPVVIERLAVRSTRAAATGALISGQQAALPAIRDGLSHYEDRQDVMLRLVRALGSIHDEQAVALLLSQMTQPDEQTRTQVLAALCRHEFQADAALQATVADQLEAEVRQGAWFAAALNDLSAEAGAGLAHAALEEQLNRVRMRILCWLSFLHEPAAIMQVGRILGIGAPAGGLVRRNQASEREQAYALETLEVLLPARQRGLIIPILDGRPAAALQRALENVHPQEAMSPAARLEAISNGSAPWFAPWTKATAIDAVARLPAPELVETVRTSLYARDSVIRETAAWTLVRLELPLPVGLVDLEYQAPFAGDHRHAQNNQGENTVLTTIEIVIALRGSTFFAGIPDDILAQVAAFVDVEHAAAGDEIFAKGDPGDSLYIIAEGQVRLHDEEYVIGEVGPYYTFGEFALLDPAPRSATALAMTDTTLIVIDQATFDELINDQSSVARRIMQMLVQRIRDARLQLDTEVGWEG